MAVRTDLAEFMAQRPDAMGVLGDMRTQYGPVGPLVSLVHDSDGKPTEESMTAYESLKGARDTRSSVGSFWTAYEELEDSRGTRKGRVYLCNKLELFSYSDRIKVLGWVVTARASGPVYQAYLVADGETL